MPSTKMTALLLVLVIILVLVALFRFTAAGPSFRAADHATLAECIQSIPGEWLPNSLERERAERACQHQERQRQNR